MEYLKLFLGIGLLIVFSWLLLKNSKRKGFFQSIFQFDMIIGIIAGLYLVINSAYALLF
jgi:hypothetical protein